MRCLMYAACILVTVLPGCIDKTVQEPVADTGAELTVEADVYQYSVGTVEHGAPCLPAPAGGIVWYYSQHAIDLDGYDHVKWRLAQDSAGLEFEFAHDSTSFVRFGFLYGQNGNKWVSQDVAPGMVLRDVVPEGTYWATFWSCEDGDITGSYTSFAPVGS